MLTELTVTLLLVSMVLTVVYGGISSLTNAAEGTGRRLINLDEARVLMAATTKDVRTATAPLAGQSPFTVALADHLQFYANLNNPGSPAVRVDLSLDAANELVETVTPPDAGCTQQPCTYTPANAKTRFVGRYLASSSVFAFFDPTGTPMVPPLTASQMLLVRSVQITMNVRKQTNPPVGVTTLVNTVGLPNVYYQAQSGG